MAIDLRSITRDGIVYIRAEDAANYISFIAEHVGNHPGAKEMGAYLEREANSLRKVAGITERPISPAVPHIDLSSRFEREDVIK